MIVERNKVFLPRRLELDTISDKDKEAINQVLKITPRLVSHRDNDILMPRLLSECDKLGVKVIRDLPYISFSCFDPKKKEIHISKDPIAIIFAHELGHAVSLLKDPSLVSKWSNKLYGVSVLVTAIVTVLYPIIGSIIAFKLDYRKNKLAKYFILNLIAIITPFMTFTPVLAQEKLATNFAVELCKKYRASNEYIKLGKACLNAAYRTYLGSPIIASIMNMLSTSSSAGYKEVSVETADRIKNLHKKFT